MVFFKVKMTSKFYFYAWSSGREKRASRGRKSDFGDDRAAEAFVDQTEHVRAVHRQLVAQSGVGDPDPHHSADNRRTCGPGRESGPDKRLPELARPPFEKMHDHIRLFESLPADIAYRLGFSAFQYVCF